MAGYWPYFAYKVDQHTVTMLKYTEISNHITFEMWNLTSYFMTGSRLAVVPLGSDITSVADWSNYGIIYQDTEGQLTFSRVQMGASVDNETLVNSWPDGESSWAAQVLMKSNVLIRRRVPSYHLGRWRLLRGLYYGKIR
jgi:hypothetical protein